MVSSIPISQVVQVIPGALTAAGGVNFMNGLVFTQTVAVVPDGTVASYSSAQDVATAFGANTVEYQIASVYFAGPSQATKTPSTIIFAGHDPGVEGSMSASVLNKIVNISQNFAGFMTAWEPSIAEKQAIATWVSQQSDRYWYVAWDTDAQAIVQGTTEAFGVWLQNQNIDGTTAVYQDPLVAAGCLGWMASLDFSAVNGRRNLFGIGLAGVSATVTDGQTASNLTANGYTFYGLHGNGLGRFTFIRNGAVSGQFLWADSYINQMWINASFQYDLVEMLLQNGNIPYNTQGDAIISASLQDTINQAKAFGAIRTGVTLTNAQQLAVINSTGIASSAGTLQTNGYYLYTSAASTPASTRIARGSPACKFWYTDGESIQSINIASIEVQ